MILQNKKILLISPEQWGTSLNSKHHYARYLSKKNSVYFLNPPEPFKMAAMNLKHQELQKNLFLVSYNNLIFRLNHMPAWIQKFIYKIQAKKIQKFLGIDQWDIVWSFDPFRFWDFRGFQTQLKFYHTVDIHYNSKFERVICQNADFVFCVADLIMDIVKKSRTHRVYKIGHGADLDNFENAKPKKLPGENNLKAGYVGNFHSNIDYPLLFELVKRNPKIDFIMIGPIEPCNLAPSNLLGGEFYKKICKLPNIFFLGPIPGGELMSYILNFDISLLLFRTETAKIHCNSHKLMGYFFGGNAILSSFVDEYKSNQRELLCMVEETSKILDLFQQTTKILEKLNSTQEVQKRRNFARQNSYDNKIKEIEQILSSVSKKIN